MAKAKGARPQTALQRRGTSTKMITWGPDRQRRLVWLRGELGKVLGDFPSESQAIGWALLLLQQAGTLKWVLRDTNRLEEWAREA